MVFGYYEEFKNVQKDKIIYDHSNLDYKASIILESYEDRKPKEGDSKLNFNNECLLILQFIDIAKAIEYLHCKNIVHKNITLENIIITNNFDLKLTGLGINKKENNTNNNTMKERGETKHNTSSGISTNTKLLKKDSKDSNKDNKNDKDKGSKPDSKSDKSDKLLSKKSLSNSNKEIPDSESKKANDIKMFGLLLYDILGGVDLPNPKKFFISNNKDNNELNKLIYNCTKSDENDSITIRPAIRVLLNVFKNKLIALSKYRDIRNLFLTKKESNKLVNFRLLFC